MARYQGAYSSGQRMVRTDRAPETNVSVSAARFRDLAGLFDDSDEVTVTIEGKSIRFATPQSALALATAGPPVGLVAFRPRGEGMTVRVSAKLFYSEANLATEFTAKSQANAVLTGVRLLRTDEGLLIQASDGQSAIFERVIPCDGDGPFEVVSPAYDLVVGVKVVGGDVLELFKPNGLPRLQVFGDDATFDCALMAESNRWPLEGFERAHAPLVRTPLVIPTALLRNVLNSSKTLQAGNEVFLESAGGRVLLRTARSEIGEFATAVAGDITGRYRFDVDLLGLAAKIGEPPTFMLAGPDKPTLVTANGRSLYIAPR